MQSSGVKEVRRWREEQVVVRQVEKQRGAEGLFVGQLCGLLAAGGGS